MLCVTVMVFKARCGLLKLSYGPFELFAVTESLRARVCFRLRPWPNTVFCTHTIYIILHDAHVDLRITFFFQALCQTPASWFGPKSATEGVYEFVISFVQLRITVLASALMCTVYSKTLAAPIWLTAVEWGFYDPKLLLSDSVWIIWCALWFPWPQHGLVKWCQFQCLNWNKVIYQISQHKIISNP